MSDTAPVLDRIVLTTTEWQPVAWSFEPGRWVYEDGFDAATLRIWGEDGLVITAQKRLSGGFVLLARLPNRKPTVQR